MYGIGWHDTASGESVLLAELSHTTGLLTEKNVVLYPDALRGSVTASLRYTYTRSGFEQDVIIREAPPPPETFGLSSKSSRLEVWTEFDKSVEPEVGSIARSAAQGGSTADPEVDVKEGQWGQPHNV